MPETRIILEHVGEKDSAGLGFYLGHGGYRAAEKALAMKPQEIIDAVKASGLRGRGGAAFPTGLKWDFVPKEDPRPRFVVANCDEGEPGTFKDREIVEKYPHLLLEGMLIAARAIGADRGFIYVRAEYPRAQGILRAAVAEAEKGGRLGENIGGTGFSFRVQIYAGGGAYICGEETALIESLEGKRGHPRLRPPYPVSHGVYGMPTVVNNVETLSNVPFILDKGPDWYRSMGTKDSAGTKIFTVSGGVKKPGVYEFKFGDVTLRELVEECAGGVNGKLVGVIPGGLSTPILRPDELDVRLTYEDIQKAGSLLGSGAVIVVNNAVPVAAVARRSLEFLAHESCGKCTPCREGSTWLARLFREIELGKKNGRIERINHILEGMRGKCFCPLGEGAVAVAGAFTSKYGEEL
jgi:NADH-quinone oxidoreductase subunit F